MNIKLMNTTDLKVLAYDLNVALQNYDATLRNINDEINQRATVELERQKKVKDIEDSQKDIQKESPI